MGLGKVSDPTARQHLTYLNVGLVLKSLLIPQRLNDGTKPLHVADRASARHDNAFSNNLNLSIR
jgi:hypothetical protein